MKLNSLKYHLFLLITINCFINPIIAQSIVFNQNFNYSGSVFTNTANGNKYFNNESFRSCLEVNNLNILGMGHTFNQQSLFPSIINFEDRNIIFSFYDNLDHDFNNIIKVDQFLISVVNNLIFLNNNIFAVGVANNSIDIVPEETFGVVIKIDSNFSLFLDTIHFENRTILRDIKEYNDSILILTGFYVGLENVTSFLLSYDLNLEILDTILINDYYFNQVSSLMIENQKINVSGFYIDSITNNRELFMLSYSLENSEYNFKRTYSRGNNQIFLSDRSSLEKQKNNFYLVGNTILSGGGPFPAVEGGLLIKTDSLGNELWQKTYNRGNPDYSEFFKGIKAHPDGTLIVAGGTRDYSTNPPSAPRGWLMKLDTAGNKIWERVLSRYHEHQWDDYVNDLILTSDGGIALAGYLIHNFIQDENGIFHRNDAWLVKTDSCGYTVGDIPEPLIYVGQNIDGLSIQLHNLSENYCTATLTWGDGTEEPIYAYSEPIYGYSPNLSHTYSEPGTYEICLEALAGEEFRTYCTEVNIQPNSISPPVGELEGVNIFPNPTNDYFILEMTPPPNPLPTGEGGDAGRGGVYSLNGQLIHQFPIKNQPQQKIDISHLADGVYVIRIENGQYTANKKLVVAR